MRLLNRSIVLGLFLLLVLLSPSFLQYLPSPVSTSNIGFRSDAQLTPSGNCFPNGPVVLTNATIWQNLQCIHSGSITFNGSASLSMINSSLVQEVVNATPSDFILAGFSVLDMVNSTLNLGGIGALEVTGNSSVGMVTSGLVNSSIVMSNVGNLDVNNTSILSLDGLNSTSLGTVDFVSSRISLAPQSFTFVSGTTLVPIKERGDAILQGNTTFELNQAVFEADNSSAVLLNSAHILVLGSQIMNSNISNFAIGNSTLPNAQTTIVNSNIQSALTTNVTVGAPGPLSTTEISSSTVLFSNSGSVSAAIYGTRVLTLSNSTVTSLVSATTRSLGSLALVGGSVSILQSTVQSSDFEFYGYSPVSTSSLVINSTLFFNLISSKLISGEGTQTGIYETAHVTLNAGAEHDGRRFSNTI